MIFYFIYFKLYCIFFKYDIISSILYFIILHLLYDVELYYVILFCIMCFSWRVIFYYVDVLFCCGKTSVLLRHIFKLFYV